MGIYYDLLKFCQEINSVTDAKPAQWSSTSKWMLYDGCYMMLYTISGLASFDIIISNPMITSWFGPRGSSYRASMSNSLSLFGQDICNGWDLIGAWLLHPSQIKPNPENYLDIFRHNLNSTVRSTFRFCFTQADVKAQLPWHVVHPRQPRVPLFCNCRLAFLVSLQGLR